MRTIISVCVVIGLACSPLAFAGKNKSGGGKGKAAGAGGGGMGKGGGHHMSGGGMGRGGGGMNAGSQHGSKGPSQRGLNARGQGNAQHNANGHGLKSAAHNNIGARGLKNGVHQNANFKNNANHFANHRLGNHWRSGVHWRNCHALYAGYHRAWHDHGWWRGHYNRVLFVDGPYWGGHWYWDGGYWFPAWGYEPGFSGYLYDGPIYAYDNLPPDQVVVNVQEQLQDLGYYTGEIDGQLGSKTRDALGAYQRDHNLEVTAAVDEPTVQALGLA